MTIWYVHCTPFAILDPHCGRLCSCLCTLFHQNLDSELYFWRSYCSLNGQHLYRRKSDSTRVLSSQGQNPVGGTQSFGVSSSIHLKSMITELSLLTFRKSHFIGQLLDNEELIWEQKFEKIHLFKTVPSSAYLSWSASNERLVIEDRTPKEAYEELASSDLESYPRSLFIFDDFLTSTKSTDSSLVQYFTAGSNHYNLSVICTSQLLYSPNQDLRSIALNATAIAIWPSFRDQTQLKTLSRQVFPEAPLTFISDCVKLANKDNKNMFKNPLLVQVSNFYFSDRLRVISGLLPDQDLVIYKPSRSR